MSHLPKTAIIGAGCIGAYLAGSLLPCYRKQQDDLIIVTREKQQKTFNDHGIKVTDYLGNSAHTTGNINLVTHTQLDRYTLNKPIKLLLVAVKCTAIESAIDDIKHLIDRNTIIIALQNGFGSEIHLAKAFPNNKLLTGVVGFNVVEQSQAHYHRGTEGEVIIEHHDNSAVKQLISLLNQQHIPSELATNITEIRWGKLLLNLNNAINALSNIPLKAQLEDSGYRKLLAHCMSETLAVLKASGIQPAKLTKVAPQLVPLVLKLPNWLFKRVANQMLAIDPHARSSMWYDLTQNRPTEIKYLNGAVVSLARQHNIKTPYNDAIFDQIITAEQLKQGSPTLSAKQLELTIK